MAGVKGKSGGARPGTGGAMPNSGGSRAGSGRKKKSASNDTAVIDPTDMLTLLQNVALGITEASTIQVRAAIAAVQYTHVKKGDGGKKEEQAEAAKKVGGGRFGAAQPPRLVASNGR